MGAYRGSSVVPKNTEEEDLMAAKRLDYANTKTPELLKLYKDSCRQSVELTDKIAVLRFELNARREVAEAQAKLDKAKADHAAALKEGA